MTMKAMTVPAAEENTDAELVLAARRREPGAYGELFQRWHSRSYNIALNILRDREAAADVVQDAFLVGWERLADLRDPQAFGGWILRTTRNRALNRVTRGSPGAVEPIEAHDEGTALPDPDADPALHAERSDQHRLIWTAVAALGERDTSLLDLHLRHGLEPAEIAEELQITPNNANQLLFRLRRKLRDVIGAALLWRDGHPTCDTLARLVAESGPFDNQVAGMIKRHQRECDQCLLEVARQTNPEALFASVPFVVAPALLEERVAAALAQAGAPMGSPGVAASAPPVTLGPPHGMGRMTVVAGSVAVGLVLLPAVGLWPTAPDRFPSATGQRSIGSTPYEVVTPAAAGSQPPDPRASLSTSGSADPLTRPHAPPTVAQPPPSSSDAGPTGTGSTRPDPSVTSAAAGPVASSPTPDASDGVTPTAYVPFCRYSYHVSSSGAGSFGGNLIITNISSTRWNGWVGAFSLTPSATVLGGWGGTFRASGASVTLVPAPYTAWVPSGASVVLGFQGRTSTAVPRVSGVTVQGHSCQRIS